MSNKIATQSYVADKLAGVSEDASRCVKKEWLLTHYSNIDTAALEGYPANQLVRQEDIVQKQQQSWSVLLTGHFRDSWGNNPVSQSNVTIENGAARFHSSFTDYASAYLQYELGDLLKTCTKSVIQYRFNAYTRNGCHAGIIGAGDTMGGDRDYWFNSFIDQNSTPGGILTYGGNRKKMMEEPIADNRWYTVRIESDWGTLRSDIYVNDIYRISHPFTNYRPTRIMLGYKNHDSLRGWMNNVLIVTS